MSHRETPTLDRIAGEVSRELKGVGYSLDLPAILAIITAIIQMFGSCGLSAQQVEARAAKPRFLDRLTLRRVISRHVSGDDDKEGMFAALLDAGGNLTAQDAQHLFDETKFS